MYYGLLAASIGISVLNTSICNRFCKSPRWSAVSALLVNSLACLTAAGLLVVLSWGSFAVSLYTLLLGVLFGAVTAAALALNLAALACGPMNLTVMLTSCAMLIPTLAGLFFWNEPFHPGQWVGLLVLIVSFVLCFSSRETASFSPRWLFFSLGTFLASGCIGILQKVHQSSVHRAELNGFLVIAFLTSACILGGIALLGRRRSIGSSSPMPFSHLLIVALITGVCTGAVNRLNLYLAGVLSGILMFPLFNGGAILLSVFVSRVLFKERLKGKQLIGLSLGVGSLFLIGNWHP